MNNKSSSACLKGELVRVSSGAHYAMAGWRCGLNRRDSCGLVGRVASYAWALCKGKRFLGRDASCEEALYERNRFVCILVLKKTRTAFNANLWGIWNGCVCLRMLSL